MILFVVGLILSVVGYLLLGHFSEINPWLAGLIAVIAAIKAVQRWLTRHETGGHE